MTYVWDGFPGSGSELLAMLAMADWCDDRGGSLYPSMKAVAGKIRVSEKQARRIIHSFEESGFLDVIGNPNGGAPGSTKHFRLNVAKLKSLALENEITTPIHGSPTPPASVTPPVDVTPPMQGIDPSHPASDTPPTHGSQTTIEPPVEPPNKKIAKAPSIFPLPDWINKKHWDAWHSCAKRKKATDAQKQMAVDKLDEWRIAGLDFSASLESSAIGGWQGLFKPDDKRPGNGTSGNRNTHKYAAASAAIFDDQPGDFIDV